MGRRLGTIDGGLGWATEKGGREEMLGRTKQRMVVRGRRLRLRGRDGLLLLDWHV